ncbi:MAG TPA: PEGA domain-containing protein [Spirochaetia bacterium]|nr:PEGA domain-containing protein [Spirochaetia bacterium]
MTRSHRLRRLVFVAAAVLLSGCASLPRPADPADALVVAISSMPSERAQNRVRVDRVRFDGPSPIEWSISGTGWKLLTRSVKPGTYRFVSRTVQYADGKTRLFKEYSPSSFSIPASSVVLLPQKFVEPPVETAGSSTGGRAAAQAGYRTVEPVDQRRAGEALANDLQMAEWGSRTKYGFGPYSPFADYTNSRFSMRVTSDPAGSELTIDGADWGQTPLTVDLTAGRHFVRLDHQGYSPHTEFVEVAARSGGTRSFSLEKIAGDAAVPGRTPDIVLSSFRNLGAQQNDYLSDVFFQSVQLALERSDLAVAAGTPAPQAPRSGEPDFADAERIGAQMVVSGDYRVSGENMLVHAVLYDTRTRLVKASTLFDERTGLSVFDAIDRMSADFVASVRKALPDIGKSVVREQTLTPEQVAFGVRVSKLAVERRRSERPYVLSIGPAFGATFDQVTASGNSDSNSRTDGPGVGLFIALDAPISGPLSLHVAAAPIIFPRYIYGPEWDFPLYVGPVYTFSNFRNDIYLGLVESVHFAPRATVDVGSSPAQYGPYWLTGLCVETGMRFYTSRKLSEIPRFWGIGLTLGLTGVRFDWDLGNPSVYRPEVNLHFVWGTRL